MELLLLIVLFMIGKIAVKGSAWRKGGPSPFIIRDPMTPTEYEHYCAEKLREEGYHAEVTRQSGDHNVDIMVRDESGSLVGIAECKRWSKKVGARYLKILYASMIEQRVTNGWFFSSGGYSDEAMRYALSLPPGYRIILRGRK